MPLLIDGHNLIGHSPDLSLSDPNDEAKLIARLRRYVARTDRQVTVVFDTNPTGRASSRSSMLRPGTRQTTSFARSSAKPKIARA